MGKWTIKALSSLGTFLPGITFPLQYQEENNGNIPFFKVSDLSSIGNEINLENSNYYVEIGTARLLSGKLFPAHSIIFAKIGEAVFLERKRKNPVECLIDNNMGAFIPNRIANNDFMYYWFLSQKISGKVETTALPAISLKQLGLLPCLHPTDMKEQAKIAELLATVDTVIQNTRYIIAKYKKIKAGLMQDLLSQGERIRFSKVAKAIIGLTYTPSDIAPEGTPVFRSNNILDSQINFDDTIRVTTKIKKNILLQNGDILMCSRNGSENLVGKVALIHNLSEPTTFGAFMTVIRSPINEYLFHWFQTNDFRKQIVVGSTTTIFQVTQNILNKLLIPISPAKDMKKITQELTILDNYSLTESAYLEKMLSLKRGLMQDLLTNRVPVDPILNTEVKS